MTASLPPSFLAAADDARARRQEILRHQRAIKRAATPTERQQAQAELDTYTTELEERDAADLQRVELTRQIDAIKGVLEAFRVEFDDRDLEPSPEASAAREAVHDAHAALLGERALLAR